MKLFVITSMVLAVTMAAPGVLDNQVGTEDAWGRMSSAFGSCFEGENSLTCVAVKGITMLNRAARAQSLEIMPGVSFTREATAAAARDGKSLSENEISNELPTDPIKKSARLLDLIMEAATNFLSSHNLQIKVPTEATQEVARAFEEGRGKVKKLIGPIAMAVGAKLVALIPILLGGLLLLATKALIVSKIAFILAAILGVQRLVGSGSGGGSGLNILSKFSGGLGGASHGWGNVAPASYSPQWTSGAAQQGWSSGGATSVSYPYARSIDAQDLAYSAQSPAAAQ